MKYKAALMGIVLLFYLAVAMGTTWPLATHLTTHLPGKSDDKLVHYWNGWWIEQALYTHQSPYYTPYLFYPNGLSLVYHNFAWQNIVEWLILKPFVGGIAAYNLSLLVNLALCGLAAFLLIRYLAENSWAALAGGLIYQCWPFRLFQLDHPNPDKPEPKRWSSFLNWPLALQLKLKSLLFVPRFDCKGTKRRLVSVERTKTL